MPHVKRLAEFMGYGFTDEEEKNGVVEKVVNICSFETLKNLEANKGDKEREIILLLSQRARISGKEKPEIG